MVFGSNWSGPIGFRLNFLDQDHEKVIISRFSCWYNRPIRLVNDGLETLGIAHKASKDAMSLKLKKKYYLDPVL